MTFDRVVQVAHHQKLWDNWTASVFIKCFHMQAKSVVWKLGQVKHIIKQHFHLDIITGWKNRFEMMKGIES